ncbi:GlxA family transcriptional regulator [Tundrisphaera sp. TA3]|uniref:GlxA family transcriptional regulator n=1 Tax=Tundrisphaera sp. TA3 TaxID=3435775 RepID=UPI003EBB21E6
MSDAKVGPERVRRVVIVAFPGVNLLDVSGPAEVFSSLVEATGGEEEAAYRVELASTTPANSVVTSSGLVLATGGPIAGFRGEIDTLLIPGGVGVREASRDPSFPGWLQDLAPRARRVGSVCTGAFLLAGAGLLDGRKATTHWRWCNRLAREYPSITVEPDAIFVRDGHVSTSAGVSAGMDLALAMVEEDLGRASATAIARHLVLFVRRPGGQSQFSPLLELNSADRRALRDLQDWIAGHLRDDLSVEALAARSHMSPRNFARVFAREIGSTPARFVERLRVDAARRRLEETDAGLERVARESGFGSADVMRRSFLRTIRVAPHDYRGRFRTTSGSAAPSPVP